MNETEEIFALMPEGYFSDAQELQKVIDSDGLESIYGLLPEGYFESQEEFVNTYGQKKVPSIRNLYRKMVLWSKPVLKKRYH